MSNDKRDIKIHLVILEGPDGVGKTTLREQFKKRCREMLGLDMTFSTPYLVMDYAAGKTDYADYDTYLQPDFWGGSNFWGGSKDTKFQGSQMEVDLHRFRYSLQMNQLTQELIQLLEIYPHITSVVLIQDRSWVSSVIYNAGNNDKTAFNHHREVVSELKRNLYSTIAQHIDWDSSYIFLTAESPDIIREHKKQRSADDYYEQKYNTEYLFETYEFWYRELQSSLVGGSVFQLVNDYRPDTIEKFTDAFIEDRLK